MKKLLTLLLAVVFVLSLAACGGSNEPATSKTPTETKAPEISTEVLKDTDPDVALWAAHGQYLLADGTANGWGGKDTEVYEKSALTAISMKDLKDLDEALYTAFAAKDVKFLYKIDLIFGTNDAGWTCKFLKDGKMYSANGSYAVKVAKCSVDVDGDSKVYAETQWISDPHTAYVESLTPDTLFYPTWQEAPDDYGFSWGDNPVVTGGAGLYTLVIAQYKTVSAAGTPGYGAGLIKKEAKEAGDIGKYEELPMWVATEHNYGVIGSFEGSGWATDVPMTKDGDNKWTAEVTLAAGDEFKVRADGDWDNSWGDPSTESGNCACAADGTYIVTITFNGAGVGSVSVAPKA